MLVKVGPETLEKHGLLLGYDEVLEAGELCEKLHAGEKRRSKGRQPKSEQGGWSDEMETG